MGIVDLDEIDVKIIEMLQKNSRLSSSMIAKKVGVSTPTVIRKIGRLEANGVIERFAVVVNHNKLGYKVLARIALNVVPSDLSKVAEQLKKQECLYEIWNMSGAHNLIAGARFREIEDLQKFTVEKLNRLDGIQSFEISIVIDIVKTTAC